MVQAGAATSFWAAVEDCLVQFHNMERDTAAQKVTGLWRRLPKDSSSEASLDDMIYHAEPWYLACNLAGRELVLSQYQSAYEVVLRQNGLS
jgi:hypothetical protein